MRPKVVITFVTFKTIKQILVFVYSSVEDSFSADQMDYVFPSFFS